MAGARFTTTAHATVAATDKIPALKSTTKGYLTPPFFWPPGHLYGMTLSNNGSDATNDIDFAAGSCVDSTGVVPMIGTALTKQLDATWAAGTNAGGKMSAAAIANTTYHCFAIRKDSDGSVDYGFDTSPTAPTMPTGYTYFRRIGSIVRVSAAILGFYQSGDEFMLKTPVLDIVAANPGTSAVTAALASVPTGVALIAILHPQVVDVSPATPVNMRVSALVSTDAAASSINRQAGTQAITPTTAFSVGYARVLTNTSAQVRYRIDASDADVTAVISTHGWADTRGRLA